VTNRYGGFKIIPASESVDGLTSLDGIGLVEGTPAADVHEALYRLAATRGFIDGTVDDDEFKRIMGSREAYVFVDYMLTIAMSNLRHHAYTWQNVAGQGTVMRKLTELILNRTLLSPERTDGDDEKSVPYRGSTPAFRDSRSTVTVELPEEAAGESA
jgi:hypothetical protein